MHQGGGIYVKSSTNLDLKASRGSDGRSVYSRMRVGSEFLTGGSQAEATIGLVDAGVE